MDKENRSGDHLKYQPLGDQDGISSKLPDIPRALQLVRTILVKEYHMRNEKLLIIYFFFATLQTNAKESSATRGLGQSASKSEMGKSQLQNDSSLQKNIQETKTITGSCIEAQRIGATPKKQLEGVKEPNMISLLHTNASSNVDDRQRQETIDNEKSDVQKEKEDAKVKVIRNIEKVQFGRYEIETTSSSPYPVINDKATTIYVCEFCLKYMCLRKSYSDHLYDCKKRCPPGSLVYRMDNICIYEVDGHKEQLYCQCLCLMSKLFLENKKILYSSSSFLFYILCLKDKDGEHFAGYFAREKTMLNINLNCILVLPPYMRKGYGKLLIDLSYEISRRKACIGGPKEPLSKVARLCYLSYWGHILLNLLRHHSSPDVVTVEELSKATGFREEDIISTLEFMGLTKSYKDGHLTFYTTSSIIEDRRGLAQFKKPRLTIHRNRLSWKTPTGRK